MSFHPLHLWASMTLMSKLITGLLLGMGVIALSVLFERLLYLWRAEKETSKFVRKAADAIETGAFEALAALASEHKLSPLARTAGALAKRYTKETTDTRRGRTSSATFGETLRREAMRQGEEVSSILRRGVGALATIGSIAPFVGLLGTVVGIIAAFRGIATTGSGGLGSVSAGISEALVETALGLLVAIPTVVIYNYLSGRFQAIEAKTARAGSELSDEMEREYGCLSTELVAHAA